MRFVNLIVLFMAMTGAAAAQNSDLGLLLGITHSSETRAGVQINYAWQFLERPAGRLYIEVPLIIPVVPQGQANKARLFLTPGIRYHFNLHPRIAVYAAVGGGIGSSIQRSYTRGAIAFGGGLDFRLTRLWSLRVDMRDLVSSPEVGFGSRNNPSLMAGFALHF